MICESDVLGVCKIVFYFNGMNMICWEICYQIGVLYNDIYLYVFFFFWLCIVWQGNWFWGYYRNVGNNWVLIYQVYMELLECVEVGIVIFIYILNGIVNVVVSNVIVQGVLLSFVVFYDGLEVVVDYEILVCIFFNFFNG